MPPKAKACRRPTPVLAHIEEGTRAKLFSPAVAVSGKASSSSAIYLVRGLPVRAQNIILTRTPGAFLGVFYLLFGN
jgi:hypothetical protein